MDNYFKGCPPRMNDGRFLTDYRSQDTINQSIQKMNGIVRDDDYRVFLQQNAGTIMDRQWDISRKTQSCHTNACLHNYPTRTSPACNYAELKLYNDVRTNRLRKGDPGYPVCHNGADYRATVTANAKGPVGCVPPATIVPTYAPLGCLKNASRF